MILIRLLGGAKKAVGGKASLHLDRPSASVLEVLHFLQGMSVEPRLLKRENLIIAINGVDSSALQGENTLAKSGDTVTVVTVVHGGALVLDGKTHVAIKGIGRIDSKTDAGKMLDSLRSANTHLPIQAVNADLIFGTDHLLRVLRITLEAQRRKIMLANKVEAEFLLRLACTDQITAAIRRVGLRHGAPACLIAFSGSAAKITRFEEHVMKNYSTDDSVIAPNARKKSALCRMAGLEKKTEGFELLNHLAEQSAILVK
ncbi:MAG: KEOPS complex subunit Cgi121 [Nitrososphaera sp.]